MSEKVTNYELSKQLHDLGFDSDSHSGWWQEYEGKTFYLKHNEDVREDIPMSKFYKAYDCWDLLMWLDNGGIYKDSEKHYYVTQYMPWGPVHHESDPEPQNALALAVIAILKEEQE